MTLNNDAELSNTRESLHELETRYTARTRDLTADPLVRELTLASLKRLINQLKEEITMYEARQPVARGESV
jgi:hypothetical protein